MEHSLPTSPELSTSQPPMTLGYALLWLLLLPFILVVGDRLGSTALHILISISVVFPSDVLGPLGPLVKSVGMGASIALLLSLIWRGQQVVVSWWWFGISVVALSSSIFMMQIPLADCDAYPPSSWVLPAFRSGIVLGTLDWFFLQWQARGAGWWILMLEGNWTLYWYAMGVLMCIED